MKRAIIFLLLAANIQAADVNVNALANAIFIAEGGHKTRYPYGVKSIRTADPRRVCIRTINNRLKLWDGKSPFIPFLADRYCPKSSDPIGHGRWIKNVTFHYEKETHQR